MQPTASAGEAEPPPSLYSMLDPAIMADPYPLYRQLREHDPVHWDPFMHSWLVTGYNDAVTVLRSFSADRAARPELLEQSGLGALLPISQVMARQMLFMDPPAHTRLHRLCGTMFTPTRLQQLRARVQGIADELIDRMLPKGRMDVVNDFAAPLPAIVTAELLGTPAADHDRMKLWSEAFAEMVGNAQHNPERLELLLRRLDEMSDYFRAAMREQERRPNDGLLGLLMRAEADGERMSEDEIVAMAILMLVGGQETTTNLIATGLLTLLRNPAALAQLRDDPAVLETGVEELLRHVSPTQHTARIAPDDRTLGGKTIRRGDAVTVVLAAANRDPARFADPDRLDLARADNRHLAFSWATHFCLGAPLARMEGRIAFQALLRRLPGLALASAPLRWREILILRGLTSLEVTFDTPHRQASEQTGATLERQQTDRIPAVAQTAIPLSDIKRQLLERRLRGGAAPRQQVDSIPPRPAGVAVPISPEQGHVWMHATLAPGIPLYNESVIVHRHGSLDLSALQRSFDALMGRHEAWRTSFEMVGGAVQQVVHPPMPVDLPLTDLSALAPELARQEAVRIATADVRSPLAMDRPPLFRARVVRLAAEEHQIQLTLHHVIFDGVSVYRVLLPELAELYASYAEGKVPDLPPPALQYGDYALWRQLQSSGEAMAAPMAHWRQVLTGEAPALELPFDRPRPAEVTYRGASELFRFPPGLTASVHAMSQAEGVTPYMTLLAAFKTLLFRYGGQEDIIVGGITDTRRRPELERMMGYFLNPIPLRTHPQASTPFRTYLLEVRDTVLGALAASDVPFDQMLRQLRIRRDPARHPLFTTMFSIQPPLVLPDPGWDLTQTDVFSGGAKFDLYLELDERPDGFIARAMYNADLFDAATMQRMSTHYLTLLQAVVADPGGTLGALSLLGEDERALVEDEWNQTARPTPQSTLHGMIREQVRRSPQAVAVSCGERSWTYAELDCEAQRLSAALRRAGAGPGGVVGLCLERSMEMVAGVLAVLGCGAAYVPLDPGLPLARLTSIIEDAGPVLLLTQRKLASSLPGGVKLVLVDDLHDAAGAGDGPDSGPDSGPDDLAYVIFTSGTTGRPKGVEVSHRAALNTIAAVGDLVDCSAADVGLAATTLSFDVSCLDLFVPLTRGGHVVVATSEVARDPVLLAELIGRTRATIMHATPALWRRLVAAGWNGGAPGFKAISAGESLPRDLADALLSLGARVWNAYGPTETAILATMQEVGRETGLVPIGRPLGNVTTAILDPQRQVVPIGVVGELHIGGAGLARGYRNRDELTRERFITIGERLLYRTGDLARYRPDGQIVFLGRRDTQVKVRGFRIELEEVEGAIAAHPGIAAAAVRAAPDGSGETSLTAYVVGRDGAALAAAELRGFLKATLPGYMIPSGFVSLDALPLSGTGKLDRAALPAPMSQPAAAAPEGFRDEWERRVAKIWGDALGVGDVNRDHDFFDLGGNSILVAVVQARIADEFGLNMSLAELFRAQTVSRMARLLRERSEERAERTKLLPIQPAGSAPPLYWIEPYPSARRVADALGLGQPVLGVSLDDGELDALGEQPSVAAMAAVLVRTLTQADPVGPYQLLGFCNKAVLAFEVASQLGAAGLDVHMLFNVDGSNPAFRTTATRSSVLLSTLRYNVRLARKLSGLAGLNYLLERTRAAVARTMPAKRGPPRTREARIDQMLAQAFLHYKPSPYGGDMTVLQVEELPDVIDFSAQWEGFISGRMIDRLIPGSHGTLFDSANVPGFAEAVRQGLLPPGSRRAWRS